MTFLESAGGFGGETFLALEGTATVWTGYEIGAYYLIFEAAEDAGSLVHADLTLPADALIQQAHFGVAAAAMPAATVSSVATVRVAPPVVSGRAACVVDFGQLTTVGGLVPDELNFVPSIQQVYRWTGAAWQSHASSATFAEVATERLLLEGSGSSDELAADVQLVGVVLPAVPGSLELQVDGNTVWFERQGSAPIDLTAPAVDGNGSSYVIDRTTAVADAFGRAPIVHDTKTIRFVLRASAPGRLQLAPSIAALRVHTVGFPPDGVVRTVDLLEEGLFTVDVTPPSAEDVREVRAVVRGSFGPERVQPPIGPVLQPDAHLVLAPGRPVLVGLPDGLTSRFGKLAGVRLVLRAVEKTNGGEVTGRLLADLGGGPGEPIAGGDVTGVSVGPGDERWVTLRFAEEVDPPVLPAPVDGDDTPRTSCWLELQLGHGSVECAFTGADPGDSIAPGGLVRRRLPGGGTAALTDIPDLGPLRVALRVVGTADRDRPIPAVALGVRGSTEAVGVNPTADDLLSRVTLQAPLAVTGPVSFDAVVAAPGTLTLDTVQVTYKELD